MPHIRLPAIYYFYPMWHFVSFTKVARNYIAGLRQYIKVYEIDELTFYTFNFEAGLPAIVHPWFFVAEKRPERILQIKARVKALIGVDVADTDRLSKKAVHLANLTDAMIVPSTYCKEVYEKSGVKVPVYVVPHALDPIYYSGKLKPLDPQLRKIYELKQKRGYIYVLYFLIHSGIRKGAPEVYAVMREILRMFPNVKLVVKLGGLTGIHAKLLTQLTDLYIAKHLSEHDVVALYDMCDIYLLFSRGGGFELNGLEALARGLVVIAGCRGSWTDYLPEFCLIRKVHPAPCFLNVDPVKHIHIGMGYRVDIEEAIDKVKDVIENLDDYKARVREHWEKIKDKYTISSVGKQFYEVIRRFL